MSVRRAPVAHRFSVSLKLTLVSWVVTVFTLLIFVAMIVPEQKRTFQENLSSKARGLSASLQDVIAGAAVTEDYSSVVDHCRQVLQGDDSIAYIVVTKNDGFSLVHESAPAAPQASLPRPEPLWREQMLGDFWHPARRAPFSAIGRVPVFERRVFHYASPFDYSGIEWGWINVGLSVQAYDRSVSTLYTRTALLAIGCIAFSLIVSILYARHLVRPIKQLQAVQQRVTEGDLAARAAIHSNDEVENLADSFNAMTETLQQRDQILECVRLAAQAFLLAPDWSQVLDDVLAHLGQASLAWRMDVFILDPAGRPSHHSEWVSPLVPADSPAPVSREHWLEDGIDALIREVQGKGVVSGPLLKLDPGLRALLGPLGFSSLILTPVMVNGAWWGILCMSECRRERHWTDAERDSLRAVADMLGATIARHRTQEQLTEARDTLEQRVRERTNELQEQMKAKEKAHSDLAEAQHRLLDLSRQAGMAEVATGVLHNVGNVLNSVNVSTTLIRERLRNSEVSSLKDLSLLLGEHEGDLGAFLGFDPRGRQVLPFIHQLADQLRDENVMLQEEQDHLLQNVEHIKEIIRMQQGFATVSGYLEPFSIGALVDNAIKMHSNAIERHRIKVVRHFADIPPFMLDKHKVIQILINLIQNAKQAVADSGREDKRIDIAIGRQGDEHVAVSVQDNGIGISRGNLTRIFSHGFSTRKEGHGFGLHIGALAAEEMGGQLSVHSEGSGLGATFTLRLPLSPPPSYHRGI